MKVAFHTLGCKVNHYETEAIKEAFVSRGAEIAGEGEFADAYIINTCTVTNIADRKSRQFIRRAKKINPEAVIAVTGCYAQVASEEVGSMPEVDLVIGNRLKSEICGLVMQKLAGTEAAGDTGDGHATVKVLPRTELTYYEDMGRIEAGSDGMSRAYIKIQDGCDRFCSYCLIPYARGPVRSRPAADIIEEVTELVRSGYREVVLTGINTALYGTEDGAERSLSDLLTMLDELEVYSAEPEDTQNEYDSGASADIPGAAHRPCDFRVRLSSLEPTVVDKDNVEEIIRHKRLCHHLHLSVQAGSDSVLKSMNRHYTRAEYLEIVRDLRDYDPLFGITTDIIVGFPGESDADFAGSLSIVKEAWFGRTHVFRYSPRRGTVGAKLPDAVPEETKKQRGADLERAGEAAAADFIKANLGVRHTVLVEEINDGYAEGYTGNYIKTYMKIGNADCTGGIATLTAATDSIAAGKEDCFERREASLCPGMLIEVTLTEAFRDGALAEVVTCA